MNSPQLISRSLRLTHTNVADYLDTQSLEDLNLVYQDLVDRIVSVTKGDYFWDIGKATTVINQSEYVAEKLWLSPDDLDIKKINKVFIKYTADQEYFTLAEYRNPTTLDKHPDWYKANQPESLPFFYIQDTSIFIYPAPQVAITGGLEMYVIHKPADLTLTSTEADIEIPAQFHRIIADGLAWYIYLSQGKLNEAQVQKQIYENGIAEMVAFMKQRYNQPQKKTITWLERFR